MLRRGSMLVGVTFLMVLVGLLAGCGTGRLKAERNALWAENQELQDSYMRNQMALDAAMAEQSAREAELQRLRQQQAQLDDIRAQLAARNAAPAGQARDTGAAFAGIEGVETQMRGRNLEVTVASDILFSPGQATLSNTARQTLTRVANVLNREHANNRIMIEGHTDTDPIRRSRWESNQALSEARAKAVADFLVEQGIQRNRIQTVGFGSTQPRDTKARSRRVEIVVLQ